MHQQCFLARPCDTNVANRHSHIIHSMTPSVSDFEGQDALFEKHETKYVPPELSRATVRMELPPSYVVVGAYRLLTDQKLLKPTWDKCRHAARRGAIVGGIWVRYLTIPGCFHLITP